MLKTIHYRITGEECEFWFVCAERIIHRPASGDFCQAGQVPADAPEVRRTNNPLDTGNLHHSFIGSRLLGIYGDGDPYMLRFENGGVITVMYDYPYSDPTEGTPFWTLDFHTPEYMAEDAEFRHHVEEVCTESQRVEIQPYEETPAPRPDIRRHVEEVCTESQRVEIQPYKETPAPRPDIRQIRYYAWRTLAVLLVLCLIIQQVQLSSQPPTWQYSLPICWFVAGLYYIGIPLLGTLLFFVFKGMGMRCRIPMGLTIIAGHMLAGHMEQFDTQIQFTTTMGSGAYGISLFAFAYYILVLLPGLCLCLFIHGAWKSALNRLGKIAEVLVYLLLSGSLLWLCVMLCVNPFEK